MATFNKFNQFVEDKNHGVHNLGSDQLEVILSNVAPNAADAVTADITQIAYTNLSSRNLIRTSSGQTSGTYKLVLADLTLSAAGGAVATFRYVIIRNATAVNGPLIGWSDVGVAVDIADGGSFDIDLDGVNGLFQDS